MTTFPEPLDLGDKSQAWRRALEKAILDLADQVARMERNGSEQARSTSAGVRALAQQLAYQRELAEQSAGASAPPSQLLAVPYAYFGSNGTPRGGVKLAWETLDAPAQDSPDDLGPDLGAANQFEVWIRATRPAVVLPDGTPDETPVPPEPEDDAKRVTATPFPYADITDLELNTQYAVKVRPISATGVPGSHSAETLFTTPGAPPELLGAPTSPTVTSSMGNVIVDWDGKISGTTPPKHFKHIRVEKAAAATGPWAAAGQTLGGPGSAVWPDQIDKKVWVRLVPVDTIGRDGTPSPVKTVTVVGLDLPDVDGAISDALQEALDAANRAQTTADGRVTFAPTAPSAAHGAGKTQGALWFRHNGTNVIAVYEWSGTAWVSRQVDNAVIANLDAGKITAGFLDAARIQANSLTVDKLTVFDFTNQLKGGEFDSTTDFKNWSNNPLGFGTLHTTDTDGSAGGFRVAGAASTRHTTQYIRVQAGQQIRFTWSLKTSGATYNGTPSNGKLRIGRVVTPSSIGDLLTAYAWEAVTGWNKYSRAYTVPDGVTMLAVTLSFDHTAGALILDNLAARFMNAGELVVDGSIVANMLAVNAVTAAKIAANAITAAKIASGSIQAQHLAVGVGQTGQRIELVPSGLSLFDSDGVRRLSLSTSGDDFLDISKKNAQGEDVSAAGIDSNGNALFQSADFSRDATFQGSPLVGSFGSDPTNGRDLGELPLLDRLGRGVVAIATVGGSGLSSVTATYQALAAGSAQLIAGRVYQWTYEGVSSAYWASGSGTGDLNIDVFTGTGSQNVATGDTTNGAVSNARILSGGLANGAANIMYHNYIPFAPFTVGVTGNYNVLARLYNATGSRLYSFFPGDWPNNPARLILKDLGPAEAWSLDDWQYRATSGTITQPSLPTQPTLTKTWNATWSVLWGPSGSIRPSGGSLYDDGRMLQGGHTLLGNGRAGRVGFPALGISGRTIKNAWIRLKVRHTANASGAILRLGTHTNASATTGSSPNLANQFIKTVKKGQELWIPIPQARWGQLASGTIRGFQIGGPNVNSGASDYVILDGYSLTNAATTGGVRPQLKITYQ